MTTPATAPLRDFLRRLGFEDRPPAPRLVGDPLWHMYQEGIHIDAMVALSGATIYTINSSVGPTAWEAARAEIASIYESAASEADRLRPLAPSAFLHRIDKTSRRIALLRAVMVFDMESVP